MVIKERQPVASYRLLRQIRTQLWQNREFWPEQYLGDRWLHYDSPIEEYEKTFLPVTNKKGEIGIVEFFKSRLRPVVLDLMSPSAMLASLFDAFPERPNFGLAVSLHDKRSPEEKERDDRLGIKQLTGDLLRASTWANIRRELAGRKADLIVERGVGGVGIFLPHNEHLGAALLRKAWLMLSEQGGVLLTQTFLPMFGFDQKGQYLQRKSVKYAEIIIDSWVKHLNSKKVRADYAGPIRIDAIGYYGALRLVRTPDSPKDLPLLPQSPGIS